MFSLWNLQAIFLPASYRYFSLQFGLTVILGLPLKSQFFVSL